MNIMRIIVGGAAVIVALGGVTASAQRPGAFGIDSGERFTSLADAVAAIGAGQGTVTIAPGVYGDCAVQTEGIVTYRAAQPGTAVFDGGACEGKAVLVLRGRGAAVDGVVFRNIAVPDGNGAGIRLEKGNLTVTNSMFVDSQQGILTASDPAASIRISRSTFNGLGRCDGGLACAHSIYIGEIASLVVERSRFEAGTGGHYVKSRARRADIVDNSFDDSKGRATNYMIDLPNGATGRIVANEMVQGADKDNYSAFIAVAAEGAHQPSDGLVIEGNGARFVPGLNRSSAFVADWSGARLAIGANDLGAGIVRYQRR